ELVCGHARLPPLVGKALWSVFDPESGALLRRIASPPGERVEFVHPSGLLCNIAHEEIHAYDPLNGLLRRKLVFEGQITISRVSASGALVAALTRRSKVSSIELREWASGELRWRVELPGAIRELLLNEPLGRLIVPSRRGLRALDLQSGRELSNHPRLPAFQGLARTPDGAALLALQSRPPTLRRWDTLTGEERGEPIQLTPHQIDVRARLACAGDEVLVTVGSALERVSLSEWRIKESRPIAPYVVEQVALAPDGTALAATSGGSIQRWSRGAEPPWPRDLSARFRSIAAAPDEAGEPLYLGGRELARVTPSSERRVLYRGRGPVTWLEAARGGEALLFLAKHERGSHWWTPAQGLDDAPAFDEAWSGVVLDGQEAILETHARRGRKKDPNAHLTRVVRGGKARELTQLQGGVLALAAGPAGDVLLAAEEGLGRYDLRQLEWRQRVQLEDAGQSQVSFSREGEEALVIRSVARTRTRHLERRRVSDGALLETVSFRSGRSAPITFALLPQRALWLEGAQLGHWKRGASAIETLPLPAALGNPLALLPGPSDSVYLATLRGLVVRLRFTEGK
ncbi:MAG TPA: hypothetical protein DEA08_19370, partial [Planctomycetes bacterium]|nr:hypothetical protein [Planctomycetota bacterium]